MKEGNVIDYSIVVPTYRRRESLARCLEAIEALDFQHDRFELLVVDDGTPVPPTDLVAALNPSISARLVCVRHGGPAAARNTGARLARGRFLVFTDDDCRPRRDWLTSIDGWITETSGAAAIGGCTVNVLAENVYATASQGIVDYLYAYYGNRPERRRFFTSNNLVVRRDDFIEVGGFDETFALPAAEDRELCERWCGAGKALQFAPNVIVDHAHQLSFLQFNRQHFGYGRGAVDLHRSRAQRGEQAFKVEPFRFYLGLIAYPLRRSWSGRNVLLALLHLWSQLAHTAGYFVERVRRGWTLRDVRARRADSAT